MNEPLPFIKMHGAGNDFVVIDQRIHDVALTSTAIKNIGHRRYGVGYDQLLILSKPKHPEADVFMHIYNPDASKSGTCGNATRCVAALILSDSGSSECIIETEDGLRSCWVEEDGMIYVDMGKPNLEPQKIPMVDGVDALNIPLNLPELPQNPMAVNMGNPHVVFIVDNLETLDIERLGAYVGNHEYFPERTNVEFIQILDDNTIRMRVWERGAGITLACGSGASAATVAAITKANTNRKLDIIADGGKLKVEWCAKTGHVLLSGPVAVSFGGSLSPSLWNEQV